MQQIFKNVSIPLVVAVLTLSYLHGLTSEANL